jgi:hypothetical protein
MYGDPSATYPETRVLLDAQHTAEIWGSIHGLAVHIKQLHTCKCKYTARFASDWSQLMAEWSRTEIF